MTRNGAGRGICRGCQAESACALQPDRDQAIWFCNEYEGAATASPPQPVIAAAVSTSAPVGLCSDCADGADCSLTTQQTAIWQCEDYR